MKTGSLRIRVLAIAALCLVGAVRARNDARAPFRNLEASSKTGESQGSRP